MTLHPQVIERKGKKEFVVLPYEEFLSIQEVLEDLKELRKEKTKAENKPTTPLDEVAKKMNL